MFSNSVFLIVINIIISLIIIYGIHIFWNYLKDTYSTKKTKDLVNTQIQKYKKIVDEMHQNVNNSGSQQPDFISQKERQTMDQALTDFMNSQV
jgi:hypothetical protein